MKGTVYLKLTLLRTAEGLCLGPKTYKSWPTRSFPLKTRAKATKASSSRGGFMLSAAMASAPDGSGKRVLPTCAVSDPPITNHKKQTVAPKKLRNIFLVQIKSHCTCFLIHSLSMPLTSLFSAQSYFLLSEWLCSVFWQLVSLHLMQRSYILESNS